MVPFFTPFAFVDCSQIDSVAFLAAHEIWICNSRIYGIDWFDFCCLVNPYCDRRERLHLKPSHSVCISGLRRAKLELHFVMEADGAGSDVEREDESVIELLRDRFRLLTISIAEAQGYFFNPIWLLRNLGN